MDDESIRYPSAEPFDDGRDDNEDNYSRRSPPNPLEMARELDRVTLPLRDRAPPKNPPAPGYHDQRRRSRTPNMLDSMRSRQYQQPTRTRRQLTPEQRPRPRCSRAPPRSERHDARSHYIRPSDRAERKEKSPPPPPRADPIVVRKLSRALRGDNKGRGDLAAFLRAVSNHRRECSMLLAMILFRVSRTCRSLEGPISCPVFARRRKTSQVSRNCA